MDGDEQDAIEGVQDGGLPPTARQEQFHIAFVRMVAAAAGFYVKDHTTDYDGVDITVASSARYRRFYCPQFELQLKCTTQRDVVGEDEVSWQMKRKPFLKLVGDDRYIPALLGILVIPADEPVLHVTDDHLLTRSRMYWQYASELGDIADGVASKTVKLPRSNLFDVEGLKGIMQRIGDGGEW
ncbi:DUF4365 domain-containing protein [Lentzea sp. NPDC042327]|uniref:DUF4365 domain-containing protein n=1 Tax=Lentzea sp. NPDC042327 TaxID=3154801 RepID=UPI0033CB382A